MSSTKNTKAFIRAVEDTLVSSAFGGIVGVSVEPDGQGGGDHPFSFKITTLVQSGTPAGAAESQQFVDDPFGSNERSLRGSTPVTYQVRRSLNELLSFTTQFSRREPFAVTGCLPGTKKSSSLSDCDFVLGLLLLMVSSAKTNNDPLLWALLTTPTEDYKAQFGALVCPPANLRPENLCNDHFHALRADGGIKPENISQQMIQSGLADRAFVTCDKLNACLQSTEGFSTTVRQLVNPKARHAETLFAAAGEMRESSEQLLASFQSCSEAFRLSVDSNYWPWTKDVALQSDADGGAHPATLLSRWMLRIANLCDLEGGSSDIVTDDLLQAIKSDCLLLTAAEKSGVEAETTLFLGEESQLQSKLPSIEKKVLATMSGKVDPHTLDRLEAVEETLSEVHDWVDESCASFQNHFLELKRANSERLAVNLQQMVVQQKLSWEMFILTGEDLLRSIDAQEDFLDADLPIFARETPVASTPAETVAAVAEAEARSVEEERKKAAAAVSARSTSPNSARGTSPRSPTGGNGTTSTSSPTRSLLHQGSINDDQNPFDVPEEHFPSTRRGPQTYTRATPVQADDGVEMTTLSKPKWKDLIESDRPRRIKPPPDDPFE